MGYSTATQSGTFRLSERFGMSAEMADGFADGLSGGLASDPSADMAVGTYMPTIAPAAGLDPVSPFQSMMETLAGGGLAIARTGGPASGQASGPDHNANLQRELTAKLSVAKTAKPTDLLNNNKAASNTVQNRQEGERKLANAEHGIATLTSGVQDIARKMDHQGGNLASTAISGGASGPQNPSFSGTIIGGLVRDTAVAGGLTALGMPFAAAVYSAASLAATMTGQGSLAGRHHGDLSRPNLSTRKGRAAESTYMPSITPSPSQIGMGQAGMGQMGVGQNMIQGAGYAAAQPVFPAASGDRNAPKTDAEHIGLAGQSLTGIAALKLVENSPAMTSYLSQRMNGQDVRDIHAARHDKGVLADHDNVGRALSIGLPESSLTRQAVLPGMHI